MSIHFDVVTDRWVDYLETHTLRLENDAYLVRITYASGNNYHEDYDNRKLNLERAFSLVDIKSPGFLPFRLVYGEPYLELYNVSVVPLNDMPEFMNELQQTKANLEEFKKKFDELFPPDRCLPISPYKEDL